MDTSHEVHLQRYKPEHLSFLKAFTLPEEQAKFTALPSEVIEVKKGQHPIVLSDLSKPVGFFLLHANERVKEYSDNPDAMLLTALSINHMEQGKGYAKKGMYELRDFVKNEFPTCTEIVLAVNHKNLPAQQLYLKAGFINTGRTKMGSIGKQFIYSLLVNE
ncbi:GNAT family N-acetyltransferase [Pseudalkalibacillus salsuginis]|uniref:GNAT family N-acetyltransferase n=1 Tax=Pseudalkalibacillus salsuginis TaxID=2910972 RepID=UPI001F4640A8|nr:GNAT family N-acetyltransferase [Pseudalkalibacillus salsuginis]MCF6409466.1 GNAT family N-acetyltransferase [Pseudalkalibacillus salsuginis]